MNLELFALVSALNALPNGATDRAAVPEPAFTPFELALLPKAAAENGSSAFGRHRHRRHPGPELLAA